MSSNFDSPPRHPSDPVQAEVVPQYYDGHQGGSSSSSGLKWLLIGCAGAALLTVLVVVVGAVLVYRNFERVASGFVVNTAEKVVEGMDLPPEQKQKLIGRIEDIGDRYAKGEITLEQLGAVGEKLAEDETVVAAGALMFIKNQLLKDAPVDEEMRGELQRVAERLARGVVEDKLEMKDLTTLSEDLLEDNPNGNGQQLRSDLTAEDFVKMLEKAKEIADEAEIPDEPYELDFLEKVDEIIEQTLETPQANQ